LLKNPGGLELVAHFSEHEHVYRCTPSGLLNALMGAKTHVGCADGMCQISANAEEVTFVVQPWRGEIVRFIIPRLLFESALSLVGSGLKTPDSPASKARLY
jgi:hypothetical protein